MQRKQKRQRFFEEEEIEKERIALVSEDDEDDHERKARESARKKLSLRKKARFSAENRAFQTKDAGIVLGANEVTNSGKKLNKKEKLLQKS